MRTCLLPLATLALATPAVAQSEAEPHEREPIRTRVYLGPQLSPATPGAKSLSFGPFIDVSRARGDEPFEFEAPDESFGFTVLRGSGVEAGLALGFEGKRRREDIDLPLHEVGFSFEIGGFVQTQLTEQLRIRAEARKAVSGHRGWIGEVSLDQVWRDGDRWLLSIGPRVVLADTRYHRAYYGVTAADRIATGLAAFDPKGGIESVGVTAGYLRQLTRRWGVAAFARYDRLVGDAADSPYVRAAGSRSQPSVGLALSYTFSGR
jgi:outer membrane scaffolding protein for murein synthesis (MipA/OmpV family)